MRETFQNDFCDVCKLQGIKVMSQLITNPPALYVAVPEVKKYIGGYRNPTKDPSAFEAANSSAYASYQNDRNSRLLSGGSKNSFDYSSMKGQQVELRTIIQNLSDTQAKTVTLRLWVEHSNGDKAVTTDGKQVFTTKEFDIPVWKEKSKFWPKGALDYKGSDFDSGLVNCSLVYTIPENAILQSGDTIGFEIVDHATGEVLADDDTEQQRYVNVTIQYQLEDGTDVPNTMPTTFTVPVGKKVDWQPPQELHGYTLVKAEGIGETVPEEGMTISYIYKRSDERPNPPVTKNYTVQYNWGTEFPEGKTPPQNNKSYPSEQQARDAVDTEYTSTTSIKGQKGGKNGTWTFSGWDTGRLINDTTVVFSGSWTFTEDTTPEPPAPTEPETPAPDKAPKIDMDADTSKYYNLSTNGGTWDGTHYYLTSGQMVRNSFFSDGPYTYYLQADGTPMKDRLTYHPDGVHVIYFDADGHEVFSDFAHISKSIAGTDVDDMCFFNVYGYMYVDTLTYDKTGTKLYYVNPYGVLERNGWFRFSGHEFEAGLGFSGKAGGYGYANWDCSLMVNANTYDWNGNLVYMQGDGHMLQ